MLPHATRLLARLPPLMLLTLLLSNVLQAHAGVIKKRETVSTLHTVVSNGSSSMENANAKLTSNSLNPVLSTRLSPEKGGGGGSLILNKVNMETLQKSSDDAGNQENKVVLEVPKATEIVKLDKVIADITLPAPITKPPNDISKNAYELEAFTAAAVEATTIASHKSTELAKNVEIFSHVNSANIEFASDNKISDSLDQQAFKVQTDTLDNERVSEATLPTVSDNEHAPRSMPQIEVEATTSHPESITISLHNPQITQATRKPQISNELQTNELLKYNEPIIIASTLTTLPEIEVTTTLAPLTANYTTILHTPNDSTTAQRATSSAEKRAKFINDNSTNTNKLQLPNAAEVWTLAGLKAVMMQHASGSTTTERAPTESSSNSEKNLLDWTQIMLAMNDGKQAAIDKTFDNLIDSSTMANKVKKSGSSNGTIEGDSTTNYMPAATMSIEFRTELNDAAPVTTVIPNVAANSVLNIETTTIAIDADTLSTTTKTTTSTAPLTIDKSLDNKGSTLASANSSETSTERAVTNEMSVHSSTNEQLNSSLTELKATTTTQSILDLPEAEKTTTVTTTTTAEADKPGVTVEYTSTAMPLPDKHFSSSTSVQPPPATSAGNTAETNSKSSNLNEHASASNDTFSTTLEHNSSDTITLSTPIASVVNTTIAIEENTQKTKEDNEEIAVTTTTTTTLEQLGTATTTTTAQTTTTTIDTDLLATVSATTAPITKTTTEANNHNWNEVDLDIGTEQTTKTSSARATTTTTAKSKEADETTTTSAAINLLITTTTTTTTAPATTPNQALPTLVTESVSAVNETTIAKEEQQQQQHVATTTSTPAVSNTTTTTPKTTTITTTSIDDNIGLEKPHETHESSIETNSIDSVEKTTKNSEDTTTATNTVTIITTISDVENNNQDMLLHTSSTNTSNIIPTSIIFTTSSTSSTSTTTTTEAPLISLLDDILTTTTTIAPQLPPPAAPPVGATTENNEMNSVYSTTTAATVVTSTTEVIPNSTIFNTFTSLIPKLIDTTSTEMPTATATTTTTTSRNIIYEAPPPHLYGNKDTSGGGADSPETDVNVIIAISVSCIGIVALVLLVAFLYVMRKRQKQMSYGQRCRPVSLDAYSMDNVSVFNSVRRKGAARSSKRSYGNVAFDDPSLKHHLLGAVDLSKFIERRISIFEEFRDVPQITARADEVPKGCEDKNRYANVIPLPETRVILQQQNDDEKTEYINANYVRGPRDAPNYYIACQAPLESTVADFWRMIWEQQSRVIIQATDLIENGIEKCAEYLPPSVTIDNHVTYGDYQITLKNREIKDKYAISTIMLKNIVENTSRELTHYWYKWPEAGVPQEEAPIIAMLLEARSSLKSYAIEQANELKEKSSTLTIKSDAAKEVALSVTSLEKSDEQKDTSSASGSQNGEINGNVSTDKLKAAARNQGPLTVHCSPGTGRTGTIIGCDMAIRCLETPKRNVDIPQIVYYVRRGRASAVQTKEQYEFIYKVANMYATKITNLSNDN